jgi:precorrin-3B synthase
MIPARTLAADIARQLSSLRGILEVHVSGCAKGCAHPASCALTVVGTRQGCGIIHNGTAQAPPHRMIEATQLAEAVGDIAAAIGAGNG